MQTEPPTVPIAAFYPAGKYPEGEIQEYRDECVLFSAAAPSPKKREGLTDRRARSNAYRTTSAECRERERLDADMYNDVRKAAEVHRAVRKYIKKIAVPGVKLIDLCETLEDSVRKLIEEKGLQARHTHALVGCLPCDSAPASRLLFSGVASAARLRLLSARVHGRPHIESLACHYHGSAQRSGPPTVALVMWQTAFVSRARHPACSVRMRQPYIPSALRCSVQ